MKKLLVILFIFFQMFFLNYISAQVEVKLKSFEFIGHTKLKVIVQIQNIGSAFSAFNPYGEAWSHISPYREQVDAYIEFSIPSTPTLKYLPSSIMAKTIFETQIPVEAFQTIEPTGLSTFYEWEMVFNHLTLNAYNVSIYLLGVNIIIENRESTLDLLKSTQEKSEIEIEEGDKYFSEGDYKNAVLKYTDATKNYIQSFDKVKVNLTESFYQLGKEALDKNHLTDAFESLSIAYKYSSEYNLSNEHLIKAKLADCYLKLGKQNENKKRFGDALWLYNNSYYLNENSLAKDRLENIESMKKSSSFAALQSIVPGIGQFYNGNIGKGLITIVGVGLSSFLAIHFENKARDYDNEAITLESQLLTPAVFTDPVLKSKLESQKYEAERKRDNNKIYSVSSILGGIVFYIYSFIDAISTSKEYNKQFLPTNQINKFTLSYNSIKQRLNFNYTFNF
ncbi:MAG: DUF5683 domain-containing protein [Ignavibacteria bacterium]